MFAPPANLPSRAPTTSIEWVERRDEKRRRRLELSSEWSAEFSALPHRARSEELREEIVQAIGAAARPQKFAPVTYRREERDATFSPILLSQRMAFRNLYKKPGFRRTYEKIYRVCNEFGDYDADFLRPTHASFFAAMRLIIGAATRLQTAFPPTSVCADGEGGLSFEWRRNGRGLLLLVPPTSHEEARLYWLNDLKQQVENSHAATSPTSLAAALRWLRD